MKTLIAFVGGVLLAGTVAFVAMRGGKTDTAQVPQTPQAQVSPQATPPQPQPTPIPVTSNPAPTQSALPKARREAKPTAVAAPVRPIAVPQQAANLPAPAPAVVEASAPAAPPAAPPVAPQAPPEPPIATSAAPASPAFSPMKPKDPPKPADPNSVTIIGGTAIPIRLSQTLDSSKLEDGQAFQATLDQPLVVDGFVIAERGAAVEGRVISAQQAGRVKGLSHLSIELTRLTTSDGQRVPIQTAAWEKEGDKDTRGDAAKVAVGAGIGAALGAIFGGGKGAATGAGAGGAAGAGTVLATRGKPVLLPAEMRLSFRLTQPVTIIERR
ncbi:MAG: hypothetical protein JNK48_27635 [Bryobacterales bacterium]|nr:hypothetical protein [Bryobacterales bacterium]